MSLLRRFLSTPMTHAIYPLLPRRKLDAIPLPQNVRNDSQNGRSVFEGASRAWGLEFGSLYRDIARDPLYREARALARDRSVINPYRQMNLFLILKFYLPKLASRNVIELGTWRGGNLLFMARILKEVDPAALVFGLDTFAGMPETNTSLDMHKAGDFDDVSMADIQRATKIAGLDNIRLVKGDVRETLTKAVADTNFGLAHIDLDIYEPIKASQDILLTSLVRGGYLVYDDATVSSCPGATQAVEELIMTGRHSEQIFPHFVFRA
jgi:Macrocin-O-methyltransferase (TylF)